MQRKYLAAVIAATLLMSSSAVLAQAADAPVSYPAMPMKDKVQEVLSYFIDTTKIAMSAEARVMAAVGMKAEADLAQARGSAFIPEATPGQMEEALQLRTSGNAALAQKLAAGGIVLSDAQKAEISAGIAGMALAVKQFNELMTDFPDLKKALRDAGLKRKKALFASRFLPQSLADSKQALAATVAFARANQIAFSAEAGELAK